MKTNIFLVLTIMAFFSFTIDSQAQTNNTFTGTGAGANNTGDNNSGFGVNSLLNNNNHSNSGFGVGTLTSNTTGGFNSAFGVDALRNNTTGSLNCAFGTRSMELNTTGIQNVAMGHRALEFNTTGSNNVAIGYGALFSQNNPANPNVGSGNIAIGANTPRSLFSGNNNVFIGNETAINLNDGSNNVIIGGVRLESGLSTTELAGNDTSNAIILATGDFSQPTSQKLFIHKNGYAGIGLGNNVIPQNRLEINGGIKNTTGLRFRGLDGTTAAVVAPNGRVLSVNASGDVVLTTDQGSGGQTIINGTGIVDVTGFGTPASPYSIDACNLYTCDGTLTSNRLVNMSNNNLIFNTGGSTTTTGGRVYIGNTTQFTTGAGGNFVTFNDINPANVRDYRLYVEGGLLTERVKVAIRTTGNWADYVFNEDYKLMSLTEVETFIKENNHLPGIDSANELVKKGLDIGDMQVKQMAKIEELTLYAIEQNKQLEKQSKEIEELKAQVKALLERR